MRQSTTPWFTLFATYFGYAVLITVGRIREFFEVLLGFRPKQRAGYAPLLVDFESFYTRWLYTRIRDCWNRPIASAPGTWIDVMERESPDYNKTFKLTGKKLHSLNLSSYNYLGFADTTLHKPIIDKVVQSVKDFGCSTCSPSQEVGTTSFHAELAELTARFVGKEKALIVGMGFATNATTLPAIAGKGSLIISDSMNHASIVVGARGSGAKIKVFRHNEPDHLEEVLRDSIAHGQPKTHRPWKKIIIVVEGIYSMEGEVCRLKEIVYLKKKYKAYLYLDEAHSIGALGKTGKGVCEHAGVDPKDVDVMMGTFTKSFGAVGGYIASNADLIDYLHHTCAGTVYATSMSPPCCVQIIEALRTILGEDGTNVGQQKLKSIRDNSNMFREGLEKRGFEVFGDRDSPVIPVMLYNPAKIPAFSRECLKRNLAVVVVGFPATSLIESRARFCISAAHTKEDLQMALERIDEAGEAIQIKYNRGGASRTMTSEERVKNKRD
eukprot:TRINITY_DN3722_c0_g1_i2.p1 TRINITY_DN3722_c0_g1~~TRINITY_DN3722_c0_g1_i2.p1  ORF type:complete len:495 (+),score=140.43 TRINITY_DN3722_c0_g1_i2:262-1746(+)